MLTTNAEIQLANQASANMQINAKPRGASSVLQMAASITESGVPERDTLILQHLGTVRMVARRIFERMPQHIDMEELVSAGLVGLLDAAAKFDPSKQVLFQSYAQFASVVPFSIRFAHWTGVPGNFVAGRGPWPRPSVCSQQSWAAAQAMTKSLKQWG